jgi:hypothetical protein
MANDDGDRRQRESRRILERVSMEESGGTVFGRVAGRLHDHVAASDTDPTDWAEHWGTRIGRTIGLAVTIVLIGWLLLYLLGAG